MNTLRSFVASLVFFASSSFAAQADINAIEQAYYQHRTDKLTALLQVTNGYDYFLASYRLAIVYNFQQQEEKAKGILQKLIEQMEAHTRNNQKDAESLALLANIYGYSISLSPGKSMEYGPKSHETIAKAVALDKRNPRVQMLKGILEYNTPLAFGGSKEKAKIAFTLAQESFYNDYNSGKHWGHSENNVWLGLTHLELGDSAMARYHWQKALEINPDNSWARFLLENNKVTINNPAIK